MKQQEGRGEQSARTMPEEPRATGEADAHQSINVTIARAGSASLFEPQRFWSPPGSLERDDGAIEAPEKKITIFAFRLAILEKAASGLGTLGFVWATVVLLGGFAITLERKDFVFITVILLTESTRIFSRSHELEWQHHAGWTFAGARMSSFRELRCSQFILRVGRAVWRPSSVFLRLGGGGGGGNIVQTDPRSQKRLIGGRPANTQERTLCAQEVQILPHTGWLFVSKNVRPVLILLQISSASSAVALSLTRLIEQDFGEVAKESRNRNMALNLFYVIATTTALLFLLEKVYCTWRISYNKLLETVAKEITPDVREITTGDQEITPDVREITTDDIATLQLSVRRFFYDAYSKAIDGSVFDGIKMDLVTFAKELLLSEPPEEQLMGGQILRSLAHDWRSTSDTLRKVGESAFVMERLIGMLNWKSHAEARIRKYAAEIVLKLAGRKLNAHRIAGVPGAMDAITSLLFTQRSWDLNAAHAASDYSSYDFPLFNRLGLEILEMLAHDPENCSMIGMTKDLLPKILDFTNGRRLTLLSGGGDATQIKLINKALTVVKLLVKATGNTGKKHRRKICEIVFAVSNIKLIIKHGQAHRDLQKLGVEILACLAMDENGKQIIGRTGGIIKLLIAIFLDQQVAQDANSLKREAGKAISMITLESEDNCDQILKEPEVLRRLIDALTSPALKMDAARILRNVFAYCKTNCTHHLRQTTAAITNVLKDIIEAEGKQLEASIGLCTQICKFMSIDSFAEALEGIGIKEEDLVRKMVDVLHKHENPDAEVPRMRRAVIEQAIWMMESNKSCVQLFKSLGMKECIENVAETTSELDNFHVFSGSVGLSRHRIDMSSLVETALNLLHYEGHQAQ